MATTLDSQEPGIKAMDRRKEAANSFSRETFAARDHF